MTPREASKLATTAETTQVLYTTAVRTRKPTSVKTRSTTLTTMRIPSAAKTTTTRVSVITTKFITTTMMSASSTGTTTAIMTTTPTTLVRTTEPTIPTTSSRPTVATAVTTLMTTTPVRTTETSTTATTSTPTTTATAITTRPTIAQIKTRSTAETTENIPTIPTPTTTGTTTAAKTVMAKTHVVLTTISTRIITKPTITTEGKIITTAPQQLTHPLTVVSTEFPLPFKKPRPYKRREEKESGMKSTDVLIVGIVVVIPVCIIVIAALTFVRSRNRKMEQMPNAPHTHGSGTRHRGIKMVKARKQKTKETKQKESKQASSNQLIVAAMKPKKMKSEKLDMRNFKDRGPLEMKTEYKGTVRHDLDVEGSESLRDLQYDPNLNSFVLIGTTVEKLMPQRSRIGPPSKSKLGGDLNTSAEGSKTATKESVEARQGRPAANYLSDSRSSVQKLSKRNDISSAQSKSSIEKWQPRNVGGDKTPRYYNLADLQKQTRK